MIRHSVLALQRTLAQKHVAQPPPAVNVAQPPSAVTGREAAGSPASGGDTAEAAVPHLGCDLVLLLAGACAALLAGAACPGCQADPRTWQGELKFLNVHAVAFTPQGRGLVMVGPRSGDRDARNATAYYYLDLRVMAGRRLGYGQYALGQALVCPFNDWLAVPTYFGEPSGSAVHRGYDIYDLSSGEVVRRAAVDNPDLFIAHVKTATADSQPDEVAVEVWEKIAGSPKPLTAEQREAVVHFRPAWVARGARSNKTARTDVVDGQTFYVLDSPDGRHRLYIRFNAPGAAGAAGKAADPDGGGYAYGFLSDIRTGKRYMLYTTSGADETLDGIGSAVIAGPAWLFKQPAKWFERR